MEARIDSGTKPQTMCQEIDTASHHDRSPRQSRLMNDYERALTAQIKHAALEHGELLCLVGIALFPCVSLLIRCAGVLQPISLFRRGIMTTLNTYSVWPINYFKRASPHLVVRIPYDQHNNFTGEL